MFLIKIIRILGKSFSQVLFKLQRGFDPIGHARKIGVRIGKNCRFCGAVNFGTEPYLVCIGDHVSITTSDFITHDGAIWVFREEYPDVDLFGLIEVGNNVFIGAGCTILPGVTIGDNVVVGAGAVVSKSLTSGFVYGGVPAKKIKSVSDYRDSVLPRCVETKLMMPKEKERCIRAIMQRDR